MKLEILHTIINIEGSISCMKKLNIDITHWVIQFCVLLLVSFISIFLTKILDLNNIFSSAIPNSAYLVPTFLSIFFSLLGIFFRSKYRIFSKEWIYHDFTYWSVFSFLLSFVALCHFLTINFAYGILTQIFAYIALFLGYANELRNEIMKQKAKRRE